MCDVSSRFRLALDVTADGLPPRLRLEMYALGERGTLDSWLTTGRNTWRSVVERLEAMKWCLPEKGVSLFDFTGLEKFYGEKGVFILYKGINHVKLTLEGDAVQAKAYTGPGFPSTSATVNRNLRAKFLDRVRRGRRSAGRGGLSLTRARRQCSHDPRPVVARAESPRMCRADRLSEGGVATGARYDHCDRLTRPALGESSRSALAASSRCMMCGLMGVRRQKATGVGPRSSATLCAAPAARRTYRDRGWNLAPAIRGTLRARPVSR